MPPGEQVVIVSYHFAANRVDQIRDLLFDLAVIDEAHKLRNVYKPENQLGRKIKAALLGREGISNEEFGAGFHRSGDQHTAEALRGETDPGCLRRGDFP